MDKKSLSGELSFSEESFQKELMVLAQSYDWLLFLTDQGLSDFIDKLLLNPTPEFKFLRDIFLLSYTEEKKKNQFTKVQMNIGTVEKWFNVISPSKKSLTILRSELDELKNKDWKTILL